MRRGSLPAIEAKSRADSGGWIVDLGRLPFCCLRRTAPTDCCLNMKACVAVSLRLADLAPLGVVQTCKLRLAFAGSELNVVGIIFRG